MVLQIFSNKKNIAIFIIVIIFIIGIIAALIFLGIKKQSTENTNSENKIS
jgi:hypothetical protein